MFSISFIISMDSKLVAVAVNSNSPNTFKIENYTLFCKTMYLLCKLNIVVKKNGQILKQIGSFLGPVCKAKERPYFLYFHFNEIVLFQKTGKKSPEAMVPFHVNTKYQCKNLPTRGRANLLNGRSDVSCQDMDFSEMGQFVGLLLQYLWLSFCFYSGVEAG